MPTALPAFTYSDNDQLVLPDARPGNYYVVVRDGKRTGWLLGPYDEHADAIENVSRGRKLAEGANHRAWSYAFGTARVQPGLDINPQTVFGR